jgi:hypothetical protein
MIKEQILDKCVAPNNDLISWKEIDNQIVFLHKKEKSFFELNKTASIIWKEAVRKQKIKQIVGIVERKYNKVKKEQLENDTVSFITELLRKEIFIYGKQI